MIAKALGVTRNAVSGRKYRLINRGAEMKTPDHHRLTAAANRLKARQLKKQKQKERMMKAKQPTPILPFPEGRKQSEERKQEASTGRLKPISPGVLPMIEGQEPKTILELEPRQCKAAVGVAPRAHDGVMNPFKFCAAPTAEGEVYCAEHYRFMYAKPKARSERGMVLGPMNRPSSVTK